MLIGSLPILGGNYIISKILIADVIHVLGRNEREMKKNIPKVKRKT